MKTKKLYFVAIAMIAMLSACSNRSLMLDSTNLEKKHKLSLIASMPKEVTTRVALEQKVNKSIELTWEEGDELQLVFVQGDVKRKSIVTVTNITESGKKAQFEIILPDGIESGHLFDLYGVYGESQEDSNTDNPNHIRAILSDDNPTNLILPSNPGNATSLEDIESRKDIILSFSSLDIDAANSGVIPITFEHLGSLYCITLKNTSDSEALDIQEAQLLGVNGATDWAYNSGKGEEVYDLINKEFLNTETAGNSISFKANKNILPAGESMTFWGWYPILSEKGWPEIQLTLKDEDIVKISDNTRPAKNPMVGKSYYLYATWDGLNVNFTDDSFVNHYFVETMGTLGTTVLSDTQKNAITAMKITGEINKADFDVIKNQMPKLAFLDLQDVTCENNEIPAYALGDANSSLANKSINKIVLPETITHISDYAFSRSSLKGKLILPSGLISIGVQAFRACEGLMGSLILPDGLKDIGSYAFANCNGFTGSLDVPGGITRLNERVFYKCSNLTSLSFNEGLEKIWVRAFQGCTNLSGTIIFPLSLNEIRTEAFDGVQADDLFFRFPHTVPFDYTNSQLPDNSNIEVPLTAMGAYKTTDNWKDYNIEGYEEAFQSDNAKLVNINVDKSPLEFFDSNKYNYVYYLPYTHTAMEIPEIEGLETNSDQHISIELASNLSGTLKERTTSISVVSADTEFENTYTIVFEILPQLDLYLCIGQSNMAGRGYIQESLGDLEPIENVLLFTPNLKWEVASNPMNKYSSTRKAMNVQRISPAYGFAKKINSMIDNQIGMVVNAKGASTIRHWTKGDPEGLYEAAIVRAKEAQKWGKYKAILWHQGEGDSGGGVSSYPSRVDNLVNNIRLDLNEPNLFFIAGQLASWRGGGTGSTAFNEMISTISTFVDNSDYISSEGTTPLIDENDPHFDRESNILLGERYAEKVLNKIYGIVE